MTAKAATPSPSSRPPARDLRERELRVGQLFSSAVHAEEAGQHGDALRAYEEILALCPSHAPACINLGTLFYNQQQFLRAEQLYRMATEADPDYALAFFDLGNVLDELRRLPESIDAYRRAVALAPRYADAHYNLALALERSGERRQALCHWTRYLRLDARGPWAEHARIQLRRTLAKEELKLVRRDPEAEEEAVLLARLRSRHPSLQRLQGACANAADPPCAFEARIGPRLV